MDDRRYSPRRAFVAMAVSVLVSSGVATVAWAQAGGSAGSCPPNRPFLTGPASVQAGQSYAVSWTNVLAGRPTTSDFYWLERSADASFGEGVDRIKTNRPAMTLPAGPSGAAFLYHRVVVNAASCPTASPIAITSNTLAVGVRYECSVPEPIGALQTTPLNPPALSTYVVSWNGGVAGAPGPGGGLENLKYRVRRTTSTESREWLTESASAAFTDFPGDYVYQVRAEAPCGTASIWTPPLKVTVGNSAPASLVLLSEPAPLVAAGPKAPLSTSLVVRNGGSKSLDISARSTLDTFLVEPASFSLPPNASRTLNVTFTTLSATPRPVHATLELTAEGASLKIPLDAAIGRQVSEGVVAWSDPDLDVDAVGNPVLRSIVNLGKTEAAFVSSVKPAWLSIESFDGAPWDAPLKPGEVRGVRISVDRAKRRATSGTEVGVVSIVTAGHESEPENLVVVDDGPPLYVVPGDRTLGAAEAKTRLLYAAMPNAADAKGEGRFTSDLWLTNMDAVSPLFVSLYFTPVGANVTRSEARRADVMLAPGETRRYRNVVGALGYEGACEVEVRSSTPTLSATAVVNNKPFAVASRSAAALDGTPLAAPAGQYGFEMRPTRPGEGVKATDTLFVLSGLAHDDKRRSNVLLTETSGADTTVQIELFQSNGAPVTRAGRAIQVLVKVPALGTVQMNDTDFFTGADPMASGALYGLVTFQSGATGTDGQVIGSVVPFATVIDAGTEDASLRVGVSTRALTPIPPKASLPTGSPAPEGAAAPVPEVGLPFGGGPAPLLFPTAHLRGAALASGERPFWKTRVTFTNVNEQESRRFQVSLLDQNGEFRQGAILALAAKTTLTLNDVIADAFSGVTIEESLYGAVRIENVKSNDYTWTDIDVQTETYTLDPGDSNRGQFSTGMEGTAYFHGYSSFQSNLGTVQIDGAETSSRYRTNLILEEVGGSACTVAVSAYLPGSFVPMATTTVVLPPFGYISKELFRGVLGLNLSELTDVRVVVRQIDGDGVFMAFGSKINLATGDPANIFLRPASAGTGR